MASRIFTYITNVIILITFVINTSNSQTVNRFKFREVVPSTHLDRFQTRDDADAKLQSPFVMSLNGYWKLTSQNGSSVVKIPGVWSANDAEHKARIVYQNKESLARLSQPNEVVVLERQFELTQEWLDRETFIEINNPQAVGVTLIINGDKVQYVADSNEFTKFDITSFVHEGVNTIQLILERYSIGTYLSSGRYLDSQSAQIGDINLTSAPKFRIEDFEFTYRYDSTGTVGLFELKMIVANGRNFSETGTVYFDLMNSKDEVIRYNYRDVTINGLSRDTVVFEGRINRVEKWSASNPKTYKLMMRTRKDGDFSEYIPFEFGFRTLDYCDNNIILNNRSTLIKTLDYSYNNLSDKELIVKINQAKKRGFNTFLLTVPQNHPFYDVCTKKGMYVIDAVDISPAIDDEIRNITNAPEMLKYFYERCQNTYLRNRNYTCIIGWYLGGNIYNGYNCKKSYLYFKNQLDSTRPVIFRGAADEWNSDSIN